MSCTKGVNAPSCELFDMGGWFMQRTNDRLYESKDSREMEKCSMSPKLLLVSLDVRARYFRGHWAFSSGGDGCTNIQSAYHCDG